jgi:succinate-semialdehyde dehydrogenase/glutarate-semialdehyde dehydrogenase
MAIATVNPATGRTEQEFEAHDDAEVEARLQRAHGAAAAYRATSFAERSRWAVAAAELLEGELPDLARIVTTEMGKTFAQAKGEVAKCATAFRWYAEHAERILADEPAEVGSGTGLVRYQPMGAVLAVMPWNFPLWQVVRFAAPALMAGNVGLLKHSSNVPQTALALQDLLKRAGFPEGAFQVLLVPAKAVAAVIADDRVQAVTLTGSEGAGRSVAEAAGRALKKTVLELGGSDPYLVMPSADLERAVAVGVQARVQNNGQSCIAAKRFIVHRDVFDRFCEGFVAAMAALAVGDPMEPATEVGPLATEAQRDEVAGQVRDARDRGAAVLCGGEAVDGPGWYYQPTVLADVRPGTRVHEEEVFGPVAMLYRAEDADDALRIANGHRYGLGSSVWTTDPAEEAHLVNGLETGMVFVNAMTASMPELPFGGVKASGYGRELSSFGPREFCVVKTVRRA